MTAISSPSLSTGSLVSAQGDDRRKLAAAAQQFEAIFVRQMLASARQTSFGDGLFGGQAMDTFRTMQDENFADIAAKSGSFGLATQIEAQLSRFIEPEG
ncbi:rod-binding protein [Novosphingobium sp.]|uniref:rod-binding protein n=1 Tax=Novosphingobium sp. TaxID=1874826 RepID=UPI0035B4E04F